MASADLPSSSAAASSQSAEGAAASPDISGLLASIPDDRRAALVGFLGEQSMASPRLLYRATRDGFKAADFWRHCANQSRTLTLVKADDDIRPVDGGYLLGAYTFPAWPAAEPSWEGLQPVQGMLKDIPLADLSRKSFLFSLTNRSCRAVKMRIKPGKESAALLVAQSFGPGWGRDLRLTTFDRGSLCSTDGSQTYEIDPTQQDYAAIKSAGVTFDRFFLAGDQDCDYDSTPFYCKEIEVWSLQ